MQTNPNPSHPAAWRSVLQLLLVTAPMAPLSCACYPQFPSAGGASCQSPSCLHYSWQHSHGFRAHCSPHQPPPLPHKDYQDFLWTLKTLVSSACQQNQTHLRVTRSVTTVSCKWATRNHDCNSLWSCRLDKRTQGKDLVGSLERAGHPGVPKCLCSLFIWGDSVVTVPRLIFLVALEVSFPLSWLAPACMPSLATTLLWALNVWPSWKCLYLSAVLPFTSDSPWKFDRKQTIIFMSLFVYLAALNFAK